MDSAFNVSNSFFAFPEGDSVEIGSSQRYRYSKTRRHGVLLFVKEPTEDYKYDLLTTEALKKEFLLGFGINHPGIVRYYSLENNRLFEEYIEGKTLRQMIDEGDRRLYQKSLLIELTRQLLDALGYLHSKGIAHLDLKPENIMVTDLGHRAKIIDLSCAESVSGNSTPGYTKGYQAPEQLSGHGNTSTDIYQLGLILEEITEIFGNNKGWKKFIRKSTANHPDNRFRNVDEASKTLPSISSSNSKWISAIILAIIIGGIIAVVVPDKEVDKTVDSAMEPTEIPMSPVKEEAPAGTEIIEEVKVPKIVSPVSPPSLPNTEDVERKLSKLIEKKWDEILIPGVTPLYEKMLADENFKYSHGKEYQEEITKAYKEFAAYGEELTLQYPELEFYIQERIRRTYEVKCGVMLEKLYPR